MIDRFSARWKEACELIDYTYAEDLEGWACPDDGIIDIHSPVLDRLSPGDVVCMNAINYSYFFGSSRILEGLRSDRGDGDELNQ